jgi:hypothetical protein
MPESVQYDVLLVSDTSLCELYAAMMCVHLVCLHAYVCSCLSVLDSNDTECLCVLEFIGARSKLVAYLIPYLLIA